MKLGLIERLQRLPQELQRIVFVHAGPLTQWLHGTLPLPLPRQLARLLLADFFRLCCASSIAAVRRHMLAALADPDRLLALQLPRVTLTWHALFIDSLDLELALSTLVACSPPSSTSASISSVALLTSNLNSVDSLASDALSSQKSMQPPTLLDLQDGAARVPAFRALFANLEPIEIPLANSALDFIASRLPRCHRFVAPLLEAAAALGRSDLINELLDISPDLPSSVPSTLLDIAAAENHSHIVDLLVARSDHHDPFADLSLDGAIRGGRLSLLIHLRALRPLARGFSRSAVRSALAAGSVDVIFYLLRDSSLWSHPAFENIRIDSLVTGRLEVLQFTIVHGIGAPLPEYAVSAAAAAGELNTLRWLLLTNGAVSSTYVTDAMDFAAKNGHLSTVLWLHANRTDGCSSMAMQGAAENGHYEIFRFLWTEYPDHRPSVTAMQPAARNGHFFIVEFFATHALYADLGLLLASALSGGHFQIVEWFQTQMPNRVTLSPDMMQEIASHGDLSGALWLHSHLQFGTRTTYRQVTEEGTILETMYSPSCVEIAAEAGNLAILKFLVKQCNMPVSSTACHKAALMGRLDVVQFLFSYQTNLDWFDLLSQAVDAGQLAISGWLHQRLMTM